MLKILSQATVVILEAKIVIKTPNWQQGVCLSWYESGSLRSPQTSTRPYATNWLKCQKQSA